MKNTNKASFWGLLCPCFVFLVAVNTPVGAAKEFKVGGAEGWREPGANETAMYNLWAASKRLQVGDSLSFDYHNDSVLVVDKWGYYHCNTSAPIVAFNNGKSVIKLDRAGNFYFISGAPDHCKNGQRMLVEVISPHPISQSPPEPYSVASPVPAPLSSSGVLVSVALSSVFVALVATFITFSVTAI